MNEPSGGVHAAPNESRITAEIQSLQRSDSHPDKWILELQIREVENVHGPTFAKPGTAVEAFTFDAVEELSVGDVIKAKAEYLGDARTGQYQLTAVEVV